eukprot:m.4701 g.4701  ORF g.4701 m.4701 type:complete len:497 (+) comp3069_c0_seq2:108-1598(+)
MEAIPSARRRRRLQTLQPQAKRRHIVDIGGNKQGNNSYAGSSSSNARSFGISLKPQHTASTRTASSSLDAENAAPSEVGPEKLCLSLNMCITSFSVSSTASKAATSLHVARKAPKPSTNKRLDEPSNRGELVLARCSSTSKKEMIRLEDNVERIFSRCKGEGKATIRFKSPAKDLIIARANPAELSAFLRAITACIETPNDIKAPGTAMVGVGMDKNKMNEAMQRKLVIDDSKDLPQSFPQGLTSLKILSHELIEAPKPIFKLANLVSLDLSKNKLTSIPEAIADLKCLASVNISDNQLTCFPQEMCTSSMRFLDLSQNKINEIPNQICKMSSLSTLYLQKNRISFVPRGIRELKSLQNLKLSNNTIKFLPAELSIFSQRKLAKLDLSNNPFTGDFGLRKGEDRQITSLLEIAALSVLQNRIPYHRAPERVRRWLDAAGQCSHCGERLVRAHSEGFLPYHMNRLSEEVKILKTGLVVPLYHSMCSEKCTSELKSRL